MGVGPKPPAVDLVKVVEVSKDKVVLEGTNTNEGYPVRITREGESKYFKKDDVIKTTFDPVPDKDK